MKKLLIMLLFTSSLLAQDLKVTNAGVEPVVVNAEGFTAQQLYDNTKLYIAKKFKNPKYVTKADENGKLLRFESYMFISGGLQTEGEYAYTCEIEFKEGKFRASYFNLNRRPGIITPKSCFNKDGELRKIKTYHTYIENFEKSINASLLEIKSSIMAKETETSDW